MSDLRLGDPAAWSLAVRAVRLQFLWLLLRSLRLLRLYPALYRLRALRRVDHESWPGWTGTVAVGTESTIMNALTGAPVTRQRRAIWTRSPRDRSPWARRTSTASMTSARRTPTWNTTAQSASSSSASIRLTAFDPSYPLPEPRLKRSCRRLSLDAVGRVGSRPAMCGPPVGVAHPICLLQAR